MKKKNEKKETQKKLIEFSSAIQKKQVIKKKKVSPIEHTKAKKKNYNDVSFVRDQHRDFWPT